MEGQVESMNIGSWTWWILHYNCCGKKILCNKFIAQQIILHHIVNKVCLKSILIKCLMCQTLVCRIFLNERHAGNSLWEFYRRRAPHVLSEDHEKMQLLTHYTAIIDQIVKARYRKYSSKSNSKKEMISRDKRKPLNLLYNQAKCCDNNWILS